MNHSVFMILCRRFDGVATIGDRVGTGEDSIINVHVVPGPGEVLAPGQKIRRAIAIGEQFEADFGIAINVKADPAPLPALIA